MKGLDEWITGHWGEDQFRNEPPEIAEEDAKFLQDAIDYLEDSQPFKDMQQYCTDVTCYCDEVSEAVDILSEARSKILEQYLCKFCGKPTNKKNTYCGPKCAKADVEGL